MTVRELIARLQEIDPEAIVYYPNEEREYFVDNLQVKERWRHPDHYDSPIIHGPGDPGTNEQWLIAHGYYRDGSVLLLF